MMRENRDEIIVYRGHIQYRPYMKMKRSVNKKDKLQAAEAG